MFNLSKRDERVSSLEHRVVVLESVSLNYHSDIDALNIEMSVMRDFVAKLDEELTVAKNKLLAREHSEIKKAGQLWLPEAAITKTPTANTPAEAAPEKKRRKAKRYDSSEPVDVSFKKALGREGYWRAKYKELEAKAREPKPEIQQQPVQQPHPQPEAPL